MQKSKSSRGFLDNKRNMLKDFLKKEAGKSNNKEIKLPEMGEGKGAFKYSGSPSKKLEETKEKSETKDGSSPSNKATRAGSDKISDGV
mmetsp:Transcript_33363/g.30330  ORF Transcript_33363/g.30330 Transcript_33363/m.30330 type:complete len:88 (-) Transcript_33363:715-978(-)